MGPELAKVCGFLQQLLVLLVEMTVGGGPSNSSARLCMVLG